MAGREARRLNSFLPTGDLVEGGWVIYRTKHGTVAEVVQNQNEGNELKEFAPWLVYRVNLDKVDDVSSEWYYDSLDSVANTYGLEGGGREISLMLKSNDYKKRAHAYEMIAGYHGVNNFDDYPFEIARVEDLRRRYPKLVGR